MNLRLSILLVSVLVIAGGGFFMVRANQPRTANPDQPWMYRIDDSVIVHIAVTNAGERIDYDRKPGSTTWYIQEDPEVPVFSDKWSGTPLLLSGPRVNRVLGATIDDPASYGLEPPETTVTVTQRGGHTFEFHLGSNTPDNLNQYARLVGTPTLFTVPSIWGDVINNLVSKPPYPRLYDLEDTALVYVEITNNGDTASYGRRYRDGAYRWFILEEDEEILVPADQWEGIPEFLGYPRAYDVLSETLEDPASYGLEPPITRAKIGQEGGGIIEFHLGDLTPDGNNRYGRVLDDDRLYAIPKDWAESLIKLATEPLYPTPGG
ncbi:MAG: hypothetical protein BZY88_11780 [SAR202 cluster bacterium Io17-Chloro-G9]|nr:MAG: hypothetical protein BZY88_11780 [SAR202 cluster bacterium Io17-Chloro-G9]